MAGGWAEFKVGGERAEETPEARPDYLRATPAEDPNVMGRRAGSRSSGWPARVMGTGSVPVDNTCSPGIRLARWREATFGQLFERRVTSPLMVIVRVGRIVRTLKRPLT